MNQHINNQNTIVPRPPELPQMQQNRDAVFRDELQESLGSTTNLVSRLKESNLKLSKQNDRAEEEIERCHDQIARQASQNHQLQMQLKALQRQLESTH